MSLPFNQSHFLQSAWKLSELWPDEGTEVAFAGRSNAGKSSAINRLTRQKNLCKTSKTPGRTQLINFFGVSETTRLVDLPGYGYAKVPIKMRQHWDRVLSTYLLERQSLVGLVIVVDIRRGLSEMDTGLMQLVADLPVHLLLSKADKLTRSAKATALREVQLQTQPYNHAALSWQSYSASSGEGVESLEQQLQQWLLPEGSE